MQLHYFWVKNYRTLKETGINLSSKYIISGHLNNDVFHISISKNDQYIDNFFGKRNIMDVSAIVGKNGSGKSTIVNYIKNHLPEGREANVQLDIFLYSTNDDKGNEEFTLVKPQIFDVRIESSLNISVREFGPDSVNGFRYNGELSKVDYIYYSYLPEFKIDITAWKGLYDISTSFLLSDTRKNILEDPKESAQKRDELRATSDITYYESAEISRAMQFLISEPKLPFDPPNFLDIDVDLFDLNFFKDNALNENDESKYSVTPIILALEESINEIKDIDKKCVSNLFFSLFINYFIDYYKYSINNPINHILDDYKEEDSALNYILRFFNSLDIIHDTNGNEIISNKHTHLSTAVNKFYQYILNGIKSELIKVFSPKRFGINVKNEPIKTYNEITTFYIGIKGLNSFLNFNWRNLSSGEQSMLSFLSRFYAIKHHIHGTLSKNLLILIDEGDIGYHPEWQRDFFNNSLDFLSNLFKDHTIQLIFTTNTPYLASDLPNNYILFVENFKKNLVVLPKGIEQQSTFAANIHTLYSDAFYMSGVLMGQFAKNKINQLIQFLKNPNSEEKANYRKLLNQIGEPVLRAKLETMWSEKYGYDNEIEVLEKRLNEIKKINQKYD